VPFERDGEASRLLRGGPLAAVRDLGCRKQKKWGREENRGNGRGRGGLSDSGLGSFHEKPAGKRGGGADSGGKKKLFLERNDDGLLLSK